MKTPNTLPITQLDSCCTLFSIFRWSHKFLTMDFALFEIGFRGFLKTDALNTLKRNFDYLFTLGIRGCENIYICLIHFFWPCLRTATVNGVCPSFLHHFWGTYIDKLPVVFFKYRHSNENACGFNNRLYIVTSGTAIDRVSRSCFFFISNVLYKPY